MTVYRHSEYDFNQRSRSDYAVEDTGRSCRCGRNCGGSCFYESNERPSGGSNYFNNDDAFVSQEGAELAFMDQESAELIWVKESCNIKVRSTDTQVGVSLQAALQLAIALVLNISIADGEQRNAVSQELTQHLSMGQKNKQKIFIYNTKDAVVRTRDTDLAINIQLLLQVLIALMLLIDIF